MDHDPRDAETGSPPIFNVPATMLALIALLVAVQALRATATAQMDLTLIHDLAFVPARLTAWLSPETVVERLIELRDGEEEDVRAAMIGQFYLSGGVKPWTLVTYAALHGGWAHLAVNAAWLLAFGSAVNRRFGSARFMALAIATAAGGALVHLAVHPADFSPMVGASAVAAGAMGAATRFIFQPGAPLGGSLSPLAGEAAYRAPAPPWREALRDRRAALFLGSWFVMNLVFGLFAHPLGLSDSPVAWEAHIGGLLAGFFLFDLLDP
ncbi:MAG: rhomboid family intramembrane serine protease [Methylobacteriaceae bacterium]|nr:rhomboid family intramembrane serine protease [Methylobacteriaceae bacterium]